MGQVFDGRYEASTWGLVFGFVNILGRLCMYVLFSPVWFFSFRAFFSFRFFLCRGVRKVYRAFSGGLVGESLVVITSHRLGRFSTVGWCTFLQEMRLPQAPPTCTCPLGDLHDPKFGKNKIPATSMACPTETSADSPKAQWLRAAAGRGPVLQGQARKLLGPTRRLARSAARSEASTSL